MKRKIRQVTPDELFNLRQEAQIATLEALLASRRWRHDELVFHGGTALRLVHNSPRFSEDLDFMVSSGLKLEGIGKNIKERILMGGRLPPDIKISIEKLKDEQRMFSFYVSATSERVVGKVLVKVEMWKTERNLLSEIQAVISSAGVSNSFVPASDLNEIMADKVFAQGGREYLKARDIFDIYWMMANGVSPIVAPKDIVRRFGIYDVGGVDKWLAKAAGRLASIDANAEMIAKDLRRWLPSVWPVEARLPEILECARSTIAHGIQTVERIKEMGVPIPNQTIESESHLGEQVDVAQAAGYEPSGCEPS